MGEGRVERSIRALESHTTAVKTAIGHDMQDKGRDPWVVVSPHGVAWLGYAVDEERAWAYATQNYVPRHEPTHYKALGWYAAMATVTWAKPDLFNQPEVDLFK